jgi:gamma-glutamyltranspeptidase / glutathione hydrolase
MAIASRPELIGTFGAVTSTHWLATAAGMAVLEAGGNAVDAAVAAGFALQVVEPQSNGLGGDLCAIAHSSAGDRTVVVCGQGPVPAAASIERFEDLGLGQVPGSGLLPACVPGAFGGWLLLLGELGTMPLARLLEPAISYAVGGYPVVEEAARAIAVLAPLFRTEWPASGRSFLVDGSPPAPGSLLRNEPLGCTLRRLVAEAEAAGPDRDAQIEAARRAFYEGFVAEAVDEFVSSTAVLDATGRHHRGFLSGEDLASWRATIEEPASLRYGDREVHKPGLWSQGPMFLQQLALLQGRDLAAMGLSSGEYIHTVTEATKLALADREAWYGDPVEPEVTVADLLDERYTACRSSLLGDRAAVRPPAGSPRGLRPTLPEPAPPTEPDVADDWMRQLQAGIPTVLKATVKPGDTCTVSTADRWGNVVAAVPSGGWLKSSPVVPRLGFPLGTRAQAMWLTRGHPNSLAAGRRPRTTLSPTVVLRDGRADLAFGTPGGDRQDQWTLQAFLAVTEFGLDLQAATEVTAFATDEFPLSFAPRASRPGVVAVEGSCAPDALDDLRRRGHQVDVVPPLSFGKVCVVGVDPAAGVIRAGAGPRGRQAYAACR